VAEPATDTLPSAFSGRVIAGGEASRAYFSAALGIETPFSVSAVAWKENAVELAFDTTGEVALLRIEARTAESKGLLLTKHLNFFFRGRDVPEPLMRCITERASAVRNWSLASLARQLETDPDHGRPELPTPPGADESQRPRSLLDTWGEGDSYADFFAGGEISRAQLDSIEPTNLFRFVQHCEPECLLVNPHSVLPTVTQVNHPWDDRHRRPFGPAPKPFDKAIERGVEPVEGMVTTAINEDDVILGNPGKLREVLDYALAQPDPLNRAIFFSNTCVPTVIGEDVESVVRQAEARSGRKIFYLTVTPKSMTSVFQDVLVDRRLEAERKAAPPPPHTINLIGFPDSRAVNELEQLIAACGIVINARFLPELLPEVVDRLPNASLNVLYPNRTWQHHYEQLTSDSRTPHITPAAPYGVEGTRRWLMEVADAVDCRAGAEQAWQTHEQQDPWNALCQRATKHRLGFVVRDEETYFLTTPSTTWGVPLVSMLEEIGFALDILLKVKTPKVAADNARTLRATFTNTDNTIRAFDSFEFLRHRLRESPATAFFSYQFFDWRLSEAGKAAFSIQQFEMGVAGAMRTVERIDRICRMPFYKKYARYLARTPGGLRAPPGEAT